MSEITQEKAEEYRQVAGLLAAQIELFWEVVENGDIKTLEELKGQAKLLYEDAKNITTDAEARQQQWNATCMLWGGLHGWVPDDGTKKDDSA